MITPREIIRDYISLLNILMQNPDAEASALISGGAVKLAHGPDPDGGDVPAQETPLNGYDRSKYDFTSEDIQI
jgi:hypothetical protein